MKRTPLRGRTKLRARKQLQRKVPLQRAPALVATDAQRAAVAGRNCIVCGADRRIDPAHVIPKSMGGCGHALCVTALCRPCHRAYDRGELYLLPHLVAGVARSDRARRGARGADRGAAEDQRSA